MQCYEKKNISNKCCFVELSIHQRNLNTTVFNIDNNKKCFLGIMWHWRLLKILLCITGKKNKKRFQIY